MSKIGRSPISLKEVMVVVKGQNVSYKGKFSSGEYKIPEFLSIEVSDDKLFLKKNESLFIKNRDNKFWGLHRALLSNYIEGSRKEFERELKIVGLGYKAELKGNKMIFSLGYGHKIELEILSGVSVSIDKSGQLIKVRSADKLLVGNMSQKIKALRKTEPYKGTGIRFSDEEILRKAGKTKGE